MVKFDLEKLTHNYTFPPFDCGDTDLNDYFLNDATGHHNQLLSVTYLLTSRADASLIGYFSVLNDKISIGDVESKSRLKKIAKAIPNNKRHSSYPAVKLGRLGVNKQHQGGGYGTAILDFLKTLFVKQNITGCRFITVDAYVKSIAFYNKNGFYFLTEKDKDSATTRMMYFDLKTIKE